VEYIWEEAAEQKKKGAYDHKSIMRDGFRIEQYLHDLKPRVVVVTNFFDFVEDYDLKPHRAEYPTERTWEKKKMPKVDGIEYDVPFAKAGNQFDWFRIKFMEELRDTVKTLKKYNFSIIFCVDLDKFKCGDFEEKIMKMFLEEGEVKPIKLDKVDEN